MAQIELSLIGEIFSFVARSTDWVSPQSLKDDLGFDPKEIQLSISTLFKGGFLVREPRGKNWVYRMNPVLTVDQVLSLVDTAITIDDFLGMSPIPLNQRQSFRYQKKAEVISLQDAIDAAKARGDIQLENLEGLAIASSNALNKYLEDASKKDKKLKGLLELSMKCEQAFWNYAKLLPKVY